MVIIEEAPVYKLCKWGHERSPENVNSRGGCIQCVRTRATAWRLNNPERYNARARDLYQKNIVSRRESSRNHALKSYYKEHGKSIIRLQKKRDGLSDAYVAGSMRRSVSDCTRDELDTRKALILSKREYLRQDGRRPHNRATDTDGVVLCILGHRMTHDNTITPLDGVGRTRCKECATLNYSANKLGLTLTAIPTELLELKRLTIQLHRSLKK